MKQLETTIQQHVESFWAWALQSYTKEAVLDGTIDAPSFPHWNAVEDSLEEAFQKLDFRQLGTETLDHLLFLLAQQWDIGIVLNWFNKGGEAIGQLGMTPDQLHILSERGLTSNLSDARGQLAASLYKIEDKTAAITLLLAYCKDEEEYVRRMALSSLHRLHYPDLNALLFRSWEKNEEHERMLCLDIWKTINPEAFLQHCALAEQDEREYLRAFALKAKEENRSS